MQQKIKLTEFHLEETKKRLGGSTTDDDDDRGGGRHSMFKAK